MGRPSKLTNEVREKLCQAIGLGATYKTACQYAGISDDTLRRWLRRGEAGGETAADVDPGGTFRSFAAAVRLAEARGVIANLAKINRAADAGDWEAAAWLLSRRYPEDYSRSLRAQRHTGPDGGPSRCRRSASSRSICRASADRTNARSPAVATWSPVGNNAGDG